MSDLLDLSPYDLERTISERFDAALGKRGARVTHDGRPGRPDIIVEAEDFAFIVEVAKRTGADAASEYLAIRDHRDETERELGKTTHLLFTCISTPDRLIRAMVQQNQHREDAGHSARSLFLSIAPLGFLLERLISSPADLHPLSGWPEWFHQWSEIGDDVVALERAAKTLLEGDEDAPAEVDRLTQVRAQVEQEALRRDVQHLEDVLRHRNVVRDDAMRALVYVVFVKLYEEKRETRESPNRFTGPGFLAWRRGLPTSVRSSYAERSLDYLLEEIGHDDEIEKAGILKRVKMPPQIDDKFVVENLLPVLDRYRFHGRHLDALGAVFEALARRAEKDTRIGQFFTPTPVVKMAVAMARPEPTDLVLDPAAGTGRFLTASMERMLEHAADVSGERKEDVVARIRADRLLGSDADGWIVTIAKMNMYIHGDGKTNIRQENGLFLADLDSVFPSHADLLERVDLVLTNPPLGDLNYQSYAQDLVGRKGARFTETSEWLKARLPILPGQFAEEREVEKAKSKIEEWEDRLTAALAERDESGAAHARKWRGYHEEKRASAAAALREGRATYKTAGNTAKGGALFLAAIKDYLKPVRDASRPEEWKGGRVGIIVDEAILNTPDYAATRRFLRRFFFLKAVVSLGRDAFWYQARTTAKTSLLYLVRKPDPDVKQREPAFYCHVESIGFTRTGQPDDSDIPDVLKAYRRFEDAMCYRGQRLEENVVRQALDDMEWPKSLRFRWFEGDEDDGERLDYAHFAAKEIRESLPPGHGLLGDYVESVARHPEEDPTRFYPFGTIDRTTGEVTFRGLTDTKYSPSDLRVIREGDVVVSGIDLVNGAVGYAEHNVDGLVVSKEFYTLHVREDQRDAVDPRYLALLLRTPRARELVAGSVTGTSNRTRIEDEDALLGLPVPDLPTLEAQRQLAGRVERAFRLRREAAAGLDDALRATDASWTGEVPQAVTTSSE